MKDGYYLPFNKTTLEAIKLINTLFLTFQKKEKLYGKSIHQLNKSLKPKKYIFSKGNWRYRFNKAIDNKNFENIYSEFVNLFKILITLLNDTTYNDKIFSIILCMIGDSSIKNISENNETKIQNFILNFNENNFNQRKHIYSFPMPIGYGNYSNVYPAVQKNESGQFEKIAIKFFKYEEDETNSMRDEYQNKSDDLQSMYDCEILTHAKFDCKYIVKFYGTIYSLLDSPIGLAMEYCEFNLDQINFERHYQNIQKLSSSKIYKIVKTTLKGIVYLHENGFIHRDIKTKNILIKNGKAKIADFGLTISVNNETSNVWAVRAGTLGYVAPEILLRNIFTSSEINDHFVCYLKK